MIKKIITMLILCLLPLIAQEDFLKGVKAEDLMLDRIEAPLVKDTIGIGDWSRFFFGNSKIILQPKGDLRAEALTRNRDGLWITNLVSGEEIQIDDRGFMAKWSPDGSLIAFLKQKVLVGKYHRGHQLYGGDELFVCKPNGIKKKNLTPDLQCAHFLWSPDNQHIIFDYWNPTTGADGPFTLAVVDVTTGEIQIIDTGSPYNDIGFTFSPNGKMIAYCKPLKWELIHEWWVTDAEIFIANIDGTGKTQITKTEVVETMVKWSDDGKSLIVDQVGPDPTDFSFLRYVKIVLKKK